MSVDEKALALVAKWERQSLHPDGEHAERAVMRNDLATALRECRREALEEAAEVLDGFASMKGAGPPQARAMKAAARAIRALSLTDEETEGE